MIAAMSPGHLSYISGLRVTLVWAMLQGLLQHCPQRVSHISGLRMTLV